MPIETNNTAGESFGMEEILEEFKKLLSIYISGWGECHEENDQLYTELRAKRDTDAMYDFIRKAYLAGALAHQEATRVEKKDCMYSPDASTIENHIKVLKDEEYNKAIEEITTLSERFLKSLGEGKV